MSSQWRSEPSGLESRFVHGVREWRRMHPREDDQRPIMAQIVSMGFLGFASPWPTFEPRVRMDIATAVQMAKANPHAWGCPLDLITDSEPVELESRVYRDKLVHRARMARQEAELFPTMHRRKSDRELLRIQIRENKLLRVLAWVAILCVAGILVCLALLVRRFAQV